MPVAPSVELFLSEGIHIPASTPALRHPSSAPTLWLLTYYLPLEFAGSSYTNLIDSGVFSRLKSTLSRKPAPCFTGLPQTISPTYLFICT
jgi:hypothetical protein